MHTSSCSYAEVNRRLYTVYAKLLQESAIPLTLSMACSTLLVHLKCTNKIIHTVSKVNAHTERKQNTWWCKESVWENEHDLLRKAKQQKKAASTYSYPYYTGEGCMDTFCTNTGICSYNTRMSTKLLMHTIVSIHITIKVVNVPCPCSIE